MLAQRQRLRLLPRIVESFEDRYDRVKGILVAPGTRAVPHDGAHQHRDTRMLSNMIRALFLISLHDDVLDPDAYPDVIEPNSPSELFESVSRRTRRMVGT